MIDESELPSSAAERAAMLETIMTERATGSTAQALATTSIFAANL
jgi:hypothetical protein